MLSSVGIRGYLQPSIWPKIIYTPHHLRGYSSQTFKPSITPTVIRKKKSDDLDVFEPFAADNRKKSSLRKIKTFSSKTENQAAYIDLMRDDEVDIVIASGPAGTGKTMLACYAAVEALRLGKVHKIVITRPVVSVDEEIGFLPGGLTSKMDPWTRPAFDALKESYTQKEIDTMIEEGVIEIVPLGFMRGRTFKHSWIVADEMQNSTPMQMLMLATRIGEGSKMIITGDLNQSDRVGLNGLQEICAKVRLSDNRKSCIRLITLESEDVQRSRAAKAVLEMYETRASDSNSCLQENRVSDNHLESEPILATAVNLATAENLAPAVNLATAVNLAPAENLATAENTGPIKNIADTNSDAALMPLKHYRKLQ